MSLTVRRACEDDLPGLLDLFQAAFGRWPWVDVPVTPLEHLAWKTEPGPGPAQHFVAEIDGKIVGAKLHHVWKVMVGGRELRTVRGADSSVHPDFQNRGVMREVRAVSIREMTPHTDLLCGGSNNPVMEAILRKGDRVIFAHRWSVLKLDLPAGESLRETTRPWTIRAVDRFDERIDKFWQEASRPFDFIMVRSQRLLNWRYADPRAGAFTIRLAEQDGRVLGYCVLRIQGDVGLIPDILALPDRLDVVDSLTRDAIALLQKIGAQRAECWLFPNHPYTDVLKHAGFCRKAGRTPPTVEAVSMPRRDIEFLAATTASVHFTAGDTDLV